MKHFFSFSDQFWSSTFCFEKLSFGVLFEEVIMDLVKLKFHGKLQTIT